MANVNEGERWTLNVCKDCGKYMREHPSYCDKTGRRHVGATNVWPVKVVPAEALREAERRLADVRLSMTTLRREHAHAWEEVDRVTHLRDLGAKVIVDTEEALREAKAEVARLRGTLQSVARPVKLAGGLDAQTWVGLAQTTARRALEPEYVADGSWSWDDDGPIRPGEPGTPIPGSMAAAVAEFESKTGDAG